MVRINKIFVNGVGIEFSGKNLILSKENSVGKTTFMRIILYSLGWNIPSTKGLRFKNLETKIQFSNSHGNYTFIRKGSNLEIEANGELVEEFYLPAQEQEVISFYTTLSDDGYLDNILGLTYFDQEKGWTLLNRGKVIGNISFKIESLLEILGNIDNSQLNVQIKSLEKEIAGQKALRDSLQYSDKNSSDKINLDKGEEEIYENLSSKYQAIKIKSKIVSKQIRDIDHSLRKNTNFIKMIEKYKIRVRVGNDLVYVKESNIEGFSAHKELILARKDFLSRELRNITNEKVKLENEMQKHQDLFSVDTQFNRFNQMIGKLSVNEETLNDVIREKSDERSKLSKKRKNLISLNSVTQELYDKVYEFASFLGQESALDYRKEFIFTSDLKRYSGAVLHLLVFAYRMACLAIVQEKVKTTFPIILDSPFGREVKEKNVRKMFKLLEKYFPNNQIIVASVQDITTFADEYKKITFRGSMMDSLKNPSLTKKNVTEQLHFDF